MRPRLLLFCTAALALIAVAAFVVAGSGDGTPGDDRARGEHSGEEAGKEGREEARELQEPSDAMLGRQLFGSEGVVPTDVFAQARTSAITIAARTRRDAPAVADARWRFEGPSNVGGRVLDIAVDPKQADTIYVATATGGVWRSTDAGRTLEDVWPDDRTQAIGALAIGSDGTLYAGTGETGPGGGSITYGGEGVFRSRNGGKSWQRVGLERTSRIGRIAVDPRNPQRVLVAASGNLFRGSADRGIYLSEDGGDRWRKVLAGDNQTTGATDVAIDPSNARVLWATMWDHQRTPDVRRYEGTGSGVYRSLDGGATWTRIGGGLFGPNPKGGRMAVALGRGGTVWVSVTSASGAFGGLYKSTDGGLTFTPRGDAGMLATGGFFVYGWWFGRLWLDPADENHVFVPGVSLWESTDGGLTWATTDGPHADHHAMAWDPQVPRRVYNGNDGGVYRSDENGASESWHVAQNQPYSQLYGLDVSQQDATRRTAGLQDNGAIRSWGAGGDWNQYVGGDGQRTRIKPTDKDLIYGCYQYGECSISRDGGETTDSFTEKVVSTRKNWFTPIELDPEDPSTLYTGGEIMSRSDDDAGSFVPISGELTNGPGGETNPLFRNYGTLTTIAPAGRSTKTIYAGTDDGNLWFTHDQDDPGAWTKASDPDLPKAWITRVEVDRRDSDVAYVTYSGFRSGDDAAYLLRTTDGGRSWENITGDLPRVPLNDVNAIGDDLFVASDVGVFVSRDGGRTWLAGGRGIPLLPVFELQYHEATRTLYAATFGRGMYSLALADLG
jgi:photosystem II stability/assembly factor-like uncharacterized protein